MGAVAAALLGSPATRPRSRRLREQAAPDPEEGDHHASVVAGACSSIGTRLVPDLIARGHEVIGSARSPAHAERVRTLGGQPIALDLLDARRAVLEAEPEMIVHQATALASARFSRSLDRTFAPTNSLVEATHAA